METPIYVTEATGCPHFHSFTCGKRVVAPCPVACNRKAAFDEYLGPDYEDSPEMSEGIPQ